MRPKQSCCVTEAVPIFIALMLVSAIAAQPAQAQTFKVLHTFSRARRRKPIWWGGEGCRRNIYGTTGSGGTGKCSKFGCGTAFELNKAGKQMIWLYSFQGGNGYGPDDDLLRDSAGDLFGTTGNGGDTKCVPPEGCGTVFKLTKTGKKETVLLKFTGTDGMFPEGPLAEDAAGNIYGAVPVGVGSGAVYKIDKSGHETPLYTFSGGSDGGIPEGGVIIDSAGNLYGTTMDGGVGFGNSGYGVAFEVDPAGNETVLPAFTSGSDGANPASALLLDAKGNLYGVTEAGGNSECGGTGCGTVFKLTPQPGGGWTETELYAFCSVTGCADGERPLAGPLAMDGAGNLYGTTIFGGIHQNCNGDACGVAFELDTSGHETVLHSFTGGADGAFPIAGLTMDSEGNLYGTAEEGGATCYKSYTCGVVFKITP